VVEAIVNNEYLYKGRVYDQNSRVGDISLSLPQNYQFPSLLSAAMLGSLSQTALTYIITAPLIEYSKVLSAQGVTPLLTRAITFFASAAEVTSLAIALPEAVIRTALTVVVLAAWFVNSLFVSDYGPPMDIKQKVQLLLMPYTYTLQFSLEGAMRMVSSLLPSSKA
jgi:hypothetical protein